MTDGQLDRQTCCVSSATGELDTSLGGARKTQSLSRSFDDIPSVANTKSDNIEPEELSVNTVFENSEQPVIAHQELAAASMDYNIRF